jgi:transmembrane sensor
MPVFNKIIALSKHLAATLLQDKEPTDLHNSELFSDQDKQYILNNLTNESLIKERLNLAKQIDKQAEWKKLKSKINVPVRKLYWKYAAAAAILVIALASTYVLRDSIFKNIKENPAPIIVNNKIQNGTDKATLTLEDGSTVILEKGATYQAKNAKSNGEQIIYDQADNAADKIAYNYLTIPRGGEFFVQLSDGTKVWLNSESQLKYPVAFIAGKTRQVELMYGEAYFEVSPSTAHNGATFKVFNKAQEIEVLGTEFNIKAYKDENNIYTTLVEGKVAVKYESKTQNLVPNQQSNYNLKNNTLSIAVVDTFNETSWKKGVFSFDGKSLKEIMTVLSRWYDVEVEFQNKAIESEEFIGVLGKNQNLEYILLSIKNFGVIKDYQIKNRKVILK